MNPGNFKKVAELQAMDVRPANNSLLSGGQPVVLRGLVKAWPLVEKANEGPHVACEYLMRFYQGRPFPLITADPEIRGRFFYRDDMRGVNFQRTPVTLDVGIQRLLATIDHANPSSVYIQSLPVSEYLPGFAALHGMSLLDSSITPRIWIGNALTVQTHFDLLKNVACVVAGKRRFILFPPEQLPNLYIGPLDFTLSGPPVSMVSLHEPDFEKYPRFRIALEHAQIAELQSGDALYIPYAWWHHVESLSTFNILVNYWWNDVRPNMPPFDSLLHALAAIRELPEGERKVWRTMFDYFVFRTDDNPLSHLSPEHRGLMGDLTPQRISEIKTILQRSLQR